MTTSGHPQPKQRRPRKRKGSDPVRSAAADVLAAFEGGEDDIRSRLDQQLERLDGGDRPLMTELVFGSLRHYITLAHVVGGLSSRGWAKIDRRLRPALLLGAYQMIWLDGVPDYAAISSAVDLARTAASNRAASFVNAILRDLQRQIEKPRTPLPEHTPREVIPLDAKSGCLFRKPVLPSFEEDPTRYLATIASCPTWLVSRWRKHFDQQSVLKMCLSCISRPAHWLRVNRLKTDGPTLADQLQADGVEAGWIADANAIVTPSASGLFNSGPFKRGMCQPQDLTAMKPVRAMNLASGQCVLDLCAGLGTKATQMAEAMGDTGAVLASDVNPAKLEQLCNNCSRLGLSSVHTFAPDQIAAEVSRQGRLDWILVDAPCSNTGVLSRRVEARYRLKPAEISTLQTTQIELLDLASDLARPETKIMYSTCSVEPEENIDAVHTFLERRQGWKLDRSHLSLPSASGELKQHQDGGFWAILLPAG